MDKPTEFINSYLSHYSDKYYDPIKAHDYYMRTRNLKPRRPVGDLKTDAKKQGWKYATKQINEAQKKESLAAAESNKAKVKALHATALKRREEITSKLKTLMELLSKNQKAQAVKITESRQKKLDKLIADQKKEDIRISDVATRKIASLPSIPKGIGKQQRTALMIQRRALIAKIHDETNTSRASSATKAQINRKAISTLTGTRRDTLSTTSSQVRLKERNSSSDQRLVVSTDLKNSLKKARDNYKSLREKMLVQNEARLNKEFDAIKKYA